VGGIRRILGVLALAKKHGPVSSTTPPKPPSISASPRIASSVAIWSAGRP
jgi:hypothetical protein